MRNALLLLFVIVLGFSACKKDKDANIAPAPVASFNVNGDTTQSQIMGVYDAYQLTNNSVNADAYTWDFGNGTVLRDKEVAVWYPASGIYTLTLTAISKDGRKSVMSKTIKVVDPVLKHITVDALNLQSALGFSNAYPVANKVNVWVEILKAAPNQSYPLLSTGTFDAPLIYKTSVLTKVDVTKLPLEFDIKDKIVIDMPTLTKNYGYTGLGYAFNLYAQDNTGTYLLSSSYGSGVSSSFSGDVRNNRFTITSGFDGSHLSLTGSYE